MPCRQYDDRSAVRPSFGMWKDDEAAVRLAGKGGDRALDPFAVNEIDGRHGDAKRWRNRLGRAQVRYIRTGGRTERHGRAPQIGSSLLEHSQPFAAHCRLEGLEASDIATRLRKTGHKSSGDWIADLGEHDGDPTGQPLKLGQG